MYYAKYTNYSYKVTQYKKNDIRAVFIWVS